MAVVKRNNKYVVVSKTGRKFGTYASKKAADKRSGQVVYFRNKGK